MKKRKAISRILLLPAGIQIKNENGLFQYYKGDFFTLFVTQPVNLHLHQQLKQKHLDPGQVVHLWYQDSEKIFEIYLQAEALGDYHDFSGVTDLGTLIPFWSLGMERSVKAFFNSPLNEPLAGRYLYARVVDLLIQMSHHIQQVHEIKVDNVSRQYAEKARQIIIDDLSIYDTVEQVARKVGVSEAELQLAFKLRFGMTVGKFSKDERMKFAHEMLEKTGDILLSVALSVGYNDPGNFSVAFKNYYGYSPGYIQRKKKGIQSKQ